MELIVVRWAQHASVYVNSCPHTGVTLNWLPDHFLTADNRFLQCSMHGALFRPNDGLCVHGPCLGARLESLDCAVIDSEVCLLPVERESGVEGDQPLLPDRNDNDD